MLVSAGCCYYNNGRKADAEPDDDPDALETARAARNTPRSRRGSTPRGGNPSPRSPGSGAILSAGGEGTGTPRSPPHHRRAASHHEILRAGTPRAQSSGGGGGGGIGPQGALQLTRMPSSGQYAGSPVHARTKTSSEHVWRVASVTADELGRTNRAVAAAAALHSPRPMEASAAPSADAQLLISNQQHLNQNHNPQPRHFVFPDGGMQV